VVPPDGRFRLGTTTSRPFPILYSGRLLVSLFKVRLFDSLEGQIDGLPTHTGRLACFFFPPPLFFFDRSK